MVKISRESLLRQLEAIQPGLAVREIVEQSSCFVFQEGIIQTFNDEIACSIETELDIEGAVQAVPLLNILRKMTEEEVEVTLKKGKLILKGKHKKAAIATQAEISLPVDDIDAPGKWKRLPKEFCEAIDIVQHCSSTDQAKFAITCIHITPDWVEACDNHQLARFEMDTGMGRSLFRAKNMRFLGQLGMEQFSQTKGWMHFKNPIGMIMSIKRFKQEAQQFPDLTPLLKVKGAKATLPRTLAEAVDKAEVFSSENTADKNEVRIDMDNGTLKIRGEGDSGYYWETTKLPYSGPAITFWIKPKLLINIAKTYSECRISSKRLKVDGGSYQFVTCLKETRDEHDDSTEDSGDSYADSGEAGSGASDETEGGSEAEES